MMPCFAVAFSFLQNFDVGKKEYRVKEEPGEGGAGDLRTCCQLALHLAIPGRACPLLFHRLPIAAGTSICDSSPRWAANSKSLTRKL